jgi:signal recognition particle receptor subunit beta
MVFFNHATRQMTAKIVYYGPGLCGKTTNLNTIYGKTSQKARGEMVSLNTETDRTLFFDLLPMDVGMVGGFKTKLQLYTVPGQVFYNSTRKLVLKGVDGIVFVVDSQVPMLDACRESWLNLDENLRELGLNLQDIPVVFQWNKRDLKNVVAVEELEAVFNARGVPSFQSVASDGTGVFETLRGITKLALTHIKTHVLGEPQAPVPAPPVPSAPAPREQAPTGGGALTLSDLPSVTDLLDMEGSSAQASGVAPLPDLDDDTGIFIEAPHLPEPPSEDGTLSFLMEEGAGPFDAEAFSAFQADEPPAESQLPVPEAPAPWEEPKVSEPSPTPRPAAKADPLAALASLKVEGKRPALRPRSSDSKDAISSLLGELTQVGRQGAPSVLRLDVPAEMDGQEVEVFVQLRHKGVVLAEGQVHRPAPAKGSTAKLSVELKRS